MISLAFAKIQTEGSSLLKGYMPKMGSIPSFRSLSVQILTFVLVAAQTTTASPQIAAWWTEKGPQILVQNLTTLNIQYSSCNSNGTPIYPVDQPNILATGSKFKPKNNTALTGVGWWDTRTTWASMYFQSDHGEIINSLFKCDWPTGKFINQGTWLISADTPSVSNSTGLASLVLGSEAGYRVYFHDEDRAINELGYTPEGGWRYRELISPDRPTSSAIHAAFSGKNNISVVFPRDAENVEVDRYNSDETWHITTFPRPLNGNLTTNANSNISSISLNTTSPVNFTLPFYGSPKGIGITIDASFTRSVWYIGTDRNLYSAANVRFVWGLNSNTSTAFWPQADEPNAPLGVTSDFSSSQVRIYYYVTGALTEIKFAKDGTWKQAQAVPTFNATAPAPSPPTDSSVPDPDSSASTGLSGGAKAGIGVGVTLGVLAIAGVLGALFYFRRREHLRQQQSATSNVPEMENTALDPANHTPGAVAYDAHGNPIHDPRYASPSAYGGSPPPGYVWDQKSATTQQQPVQLDAGDIPQELEGPRLMYELPDQAYSHELVGDGRVGAELPGSEHGDGNGNGNGQVKK
ncbi:hypothetical protein GE09DRAFT_1129000 [Coniochaeta sp. 2T2.1]|nr:hypothetical protein GE09DRAFT_1129000 [Coniochaeta sp. 2T2.1]